MATSEYLRNDTRTRGAIVSQLPPRIRRRRGMGPTAAAAAVMVINDLLMILLAFGMAVVLRGTVVARLLPASAGHAKTGMNSLDFAYLGWFVLSYILVSRRYGLYGATPSGPIGHEVRLVMQACLNAGLMLCGALYMFHAVIISRMLVMLLIVTSSGTLSVRRIVWRISRYRHYEQGIELRNIVILGTNQMSYALARHIQREHRLGYRFVGFLSVPGSPIGAEIVREQLLGGVDKLRQLTRMHFIDELVIGEYYPTEQAVRLVEDARDLDIDVRAMAGYYGDLTTNAPVEYLGIFPVSSLHRRQPRIIGLFFKRMVDIVLSSAALLSVAPIMLTIAVAIKLESKGPVFYVSNRIGKRGREFPCFKFRTMVRDAERLKKELVPLNERDGVLFKMKNDPRITPLGRLLRKYSLDELPQFLNVLRGEMSIVGPRPPIVAEVEKYELEHLRRLEVLPGLTGLWQVQARHDPSFAKYIALDTAYVENWSFWLDLKILVRTADVVVRGTGT